MRPRIAHGQTGRAAGTRAARFIVEIIEARAGERLSASCIDKHLVIIDSGASAAWASIEGDMSMDPIARMIAQGECANLLTDYCAAFDDRRVYDAVALFLPSARWTRPGSPDAEGLDAIRALVGSAPPTVAIKHILSNIRIHVLGENQATARSVFTVYSGPVGGQLPAIEPVMIGEYHDRLSRTADGWRFAQRETRYLFLRGQG